MKFAKFMSTPLGRSLRLVPGIALVILGVLQASLLFGVIGAVLIASGALNMCALAALFGGPIEGRKAK